MFRVGHDPIRVILTEGSGDPERGSSVRTISWFLSYGFPHGCRSVWGRLFWLRNWRRRLGAWLPRSAGGQSPARAGGGGPLKAGAAKIHARICPCRANRRMPTVPPTRDISWSAAGRRAGSAWLLRLWRPLHPLRPARLRAGKDGESGGKQAPVVAPLPSSLTGTPTARFCSISTELDDPTLAAFAFSSTRPAKDYKPTEPATPTAPTFNADR